MLVEILTALVMNVFESKTTFAVGLVTITEAVVEPLDIARAELPPPPDTCVAALIVWLGHDPVIDVILVPAIRPGDAVPVPPFGTGKIFDLLK